MKTKIVLFALSLSLIINGCGSEKDKNESTVTLPEGDKIAPVITLQGDKEILLSIGESYQDQGATAIDNIDGDLSSSIQTTINMNINIAGNYTITYQVSDTDKNSATVVRDIIIQDIIKSPNPREGLTINEVLTANAYSGMDPDFKEFSDWIELYNNDSSAKDIGGYYLSDDANNTTKWQIPIGTTIDKESYLLIWADKKNIALHTNFKLNSDGESLILSDKNAKIIDSIKFDKQKSNISCTKINGKIYYMNPTPQSANSVAHSESWKSKKPDFSLNSGFYNGSQTIELSTKNQGEIYYTLDGSIPTKNSELYTQAISIGKTTVLRTRSLENGKFFSSVKNKTYLINEDITLPVVSIAIDDKFLSDDDIGIYKNFTEDWTRPASIEYIKDGESKFSENVGIRIFGGFTRNHAQKSLAIFAKDKYGPKSIKYPLFPDKQEIKKIKSFILRISGNDWGLTMMKDGLVHSIIKDNMDIDYQSYHPTIVFINGKYWGIHNIREKINEDYLEANHGVDEKIDLLRNNSIVHSGTDIEYKKLLDFMKLNDLSNSSNYDYILSKIDKEEYMNYMITEIYVGNFGWPYNNVKYWRERKSDGKWRWILFDTDSSFNQINLDSFKHALHENSPIEKNPPWSTFVFRNLMKNSDFQNEFISRFSSHLNTTFQPNTIAKIITELKDNIKPEIPRHFVKWPRRNEHDWENGTWGSIRELYNFSNQRGDAIKGFMELNFGVSGNNNLLIEKAQNGQVSIHDILLYETYSGTYFNNAKVTLKAVADEGYRFVRWSDGQTDNTIELTLNTDQTIDAIFE